MCRKEEGEDGLYQVWLSVVNRRRLIGEVITHDVFQVRGQKICCYVARGSDYDWRELFNDTCINLMIRWSTLVQAKGPDKGSFQADLSDEEAFRANIADEEAFFKWYLVMATNLLRDHYRKDGKARRWGVTIVELPEEELRVEDSSIDIEGQCRVDEFLESTANWPRGRRRALELRLENYPQKGRPYAEISETLKGEGIECSPAQARKWVLDGLKDLCDDNRTSSPQKAAV